MDTDVRVLGRVYALVWPPDPAGSFAVSENYGDTFRVGYRTFRSRARPSDLFRSSSGLHVSHDGGESWTELAGAKLIFDSLFWNQGTPGLIWSKRRHQTDEPILTGDVVQQVEGDPVNAQIFYLLNRWRGVFRTVDGGRSFRLLPIRDNNYLDIAEIVVDPVAGNWIYLIAGYSLYVSNDYGCTWTKTEVR